jgi:hypothetical protein
MQLSDEGTSSTSDVDRYVFIRKLQYLLLTHIWYSYAGGKFKHAYAKCTHIYGTVSSTRVRRVDALHLDALNTLQLRTEAEKKFTS